MSEADVSTLSQSARRCAGRLRQGRWPALLLLATVLASTAHGVESAVEAGGKRTDAVILDPERVPSLEGLIRAGLERSAHGDLAGAERYWAQIREYHPDHPAGPLFEMQTLEARKSLDYQDDHYDAQLRAKAEEAITLSEEWLERAPDDPQAHFYAGQAKVEMMIVAGVAGQYYKAGTIGEQGRKHLERALELDPDLVDAKLPLGSYHYYTAIATRFIRLFSWLWFVPTGDRETGLAYIEEVSRKGDLYRFDASAQLANILLYMEDAPERAAPILERLHRTHPESGYLAFEVVELKMIEGDYAGTVEKALELEQSHGSQFGDATRRTMAKIWRARAELHRGHPERTRAILAEIDASGQDLSGWCRRWMLLTRGNLEDLLDRRDEAVEYYEDVVALESRWQSGRSVELARQLLETPFRLDAAAQPPFVSASPPGAPPARN
ncbi:MAG: hypothetical protein ACQGVK_03410 [Myxococcota bacterium]